MLLLKMKSVEIYTYKKIFLSSLVILSTAVELVPLRERRGSDLHQKHQRELKNTYNSKTHK